MDVGSAGAAQSVACRERSDFSGEQVVREVTTYL